MLLFCDGFDNYLLQTNLWDFAGTDCEIRLNTGEARTGIGCIRFNSAAFGPRRSLGHMTHLLGCVAWNSSGPGECMRFNTVVSGVTNGPCVKVAINADRSISFFPQVGPPLGTTAIGIVAFNTYNSIAVEVENFTTNTGIITCWVNGVQVFHASGLHTVGDPTVPFCNEWQIMGPGGLPNCFADDVYLLDCTTAPNNAFLGALRLYALPPTANVSVSWIPLSGTNWSQVNEVPPDGDASYVSSGNVGDVDQYSYPLTGPPVGSTLLFVQHELDMQVDTGSRSVASDVGGVVSAGIALSNGYHIYPFPYDTNPATGVAFAAADFPLAAGPKVTA